MLNKHFKLLSFCLIFVMIRRIVLKHNKENKDKIKIWSEWYMYFNMCFNNLLTYNQSSWNAACGPPYMGMIHWAR